MTNLGPNIKSTLLVYLEANESGFASVCLMARIAHFISAMTYSNW